VGDIRGLVKLKNTKTEYLSMPQVNDWKYEGVKFPDPSTERLLKLRVKAMMRNLGKP